MKKAFLFLLFSILAYSGFAQYTLRGSIIDFSSGESIAGANVILSNDGTTIGTTSFEDGSFQISLKSKPYALEVNHIAYESLQTSIHLSKDSFMTISLKDRIEVKDLVLVKGIRAVKGAPITFTNLKKSDIEKVNFGQDLPYVLSQTPSVLVHSDAGAGVGYTGMRIRGVDPTRINVTINGIPLNDAESHGVYWVDLPDISSSVNSIQVQRGVGSSTNGSAAFGASVNLKTDAISQKPFGKINAGVGSFNTSRMSAEFGTGLINDHWGIQGRVSQIKSDGFIDRAASDLESLFLTAARYGEKSVLKLVMMKGFERTYQAWYGVPQVKYKQDEEGLSTFISELGVSGSYAENLLESEHNKHNYYTYPNQVDNYNQDHHQLFYTRQFDKKWSWKGAAHYTRGYGYYEQFQDKENWLDATQFSDYGLEDVIVGSDTIRSGDFVRRRWLDNHFYGAQSTLHFDNTNSNFDWGLAFQQYDGKHFGEIIWAEYASNSELGSRYYENQAVKTEGNTFFKYTRELNNRLDIFGDAQLRWINYEFEGPDQNGELIDQQDDFLFFNPKAGINYKLTSKSNVYLSIAQSNREPVRQDYVESSESSRPKKESLTDIEFGTRWESNEAYSALNVYAMEYKDQLVLTGKINDVGAATRQNVAKSFRRGLELEGAIKINAKWEMAGNFNYSLNKILDYDEFVDDWINGGQVQFVYEKTNLAFSPDYILSTMVTYQPSKDLRFSLISKAVGAQYLDNSQSEDRKLDEYALLNANATYDFKFFDLSWQLSAMVNNIANLDYAPNGYTFGAVLDGDRKSYNYVYPQAERNFLIRLNVKIE